MAYEQIVIVNSTTGEMTRRDWTDAEILRFKPERVVLSLDKTTITADGVDAATLTVQLTTPVLMDGSTNNVARDISVTVQVDEETVEVALTGGVGTVEVTAVEAGTFTITGVSHPANELTVEAT